MPDNTTPNGFARDPFQEWRRPTTGIERVYSEGRPSNPNMPAGMRDSGAYWRNVQSNELAGNRLTAGLASGGAYLTGARARGQRFAASRGMRGSTAAAAAEQAGIDAYAPIALSEAQTFAQAASQNQDAFNQMRIAQERNMTDIGVASIGAGAQVVSQQIRVGGDLIQQERDQRWRSTESELDRRQQTSEREGEQRWRSGENALDRQQQTNERMGSERSANAVLRAQFIREFMANNPDIWNDPTAAAGFMEFLDSLIGGDSNGAPVGTPLGGRNTPTAGIRDATSTPVSAVSSAPAQGAAAQPKSNPVPQRQARRWRQQMSRADARMQR